MYEPFIKTKITIQAPVDKVWEILVKEQYTQQWINEFSGGNVVTEDWQLNSNIAMTDDDGTILIEGTITEFEPNRRLKIEFEHSDYTEELALSEKGNHTLLSSHAGPVDPDKHEQHVEVWEKGLNKIKVLSEAL